MNERLKSKKHINAWCQSHHIGTYEVLLDSNNEWYVNVWGDVDFSYSKTPYIPVKFDTVGGDFDCHSCGLLTLENSPRVVGGNFNCSYNALTNLQGGPEVVDNHYDCTRNQIKSLEFCPTEVGGKFDCNRNPELQEVQNISDFSSILKIHQCYQDIVQEKNDLIDMFQDKRHILDPISNPQTTHKKLKI